MSDLNREFVDSREAYAVSELEAYNADMEAGEAWIEDEEDEEWDYEDDGQPDEMLEWEGLADAGYGTDEDYGGCGGEDW